MSVRARSPARIISYYLSIALLCISGEIAGLWVGNTLFSHKPGPIVGGKRSRPCPSDVLGCERTTGKGVEVQRTASEDLAHCGALQGML